MNRLKLFLPLVVFSALAILLWRGLSLDPTYMPSALQDRPLPAFSLPALEDNTRQLTHKDVSGRKALVNIWATWCITCRVEHPYLVQLQKQGVLLIGVNYKDKPEEALQWLLKKGNPFEFSIQDTDGKLGIDLGVFGAPETYFVDSAGVIRYKHTGDLNERIWTEKLKAIYDSLP
jgi:cytochrome c biogenesis protein CcmG/thiol:disulfide interchange protein DsbE